MPLHPIENAKKVYLAKVVPWPQTPDDGYIDIIWSQPSLNGSGKKLRWTGRAVKTLDEAVRTVEWINKQPDTVGVYACLSRQRLAEEKISKLGNKYLEAKRSQENAIELKSLFVDIDFDDYSSPDEAIKELERFLRESALPKPNVIVRSGNGLHVYHTFNRPLPVGEWSVLAHALVNAIKQHGLKADTGCTIDAARVLRIPQTLNKKREEPRPVVLQGAAEFDYSVEILEKALAPYKTQLPALPVSSEITIPAPSPSVIAKLKFLDDGPLGAGIESQYPPFKLTDLAVECAFIRDAIATGGASYKNPLWSLTTLVATFTEGGRADAHAMASGHAEYAKETTDALYDRKTREKAEKSLGWPHCKTISAQGCTACQTCKHFAAGKTPFHFLDRTQPSAHLQQGERIETGTDVNSFADPWAEFVGPPFPLSILPSPLASFVDAEHRAMGADPSAIAMAALTAFGSAIHAETHVGVGEGWDEKPILWTALVGPPSAMKSPIIQKVTAPLRKIDHQRDWVWRQKVATWNQTKAGGTNPGPYPAKARRLLIQDATPEKVAEILSRDPAGALMMQDELAGWLAGFERYNVGQSARAFHLSCWNGGLFLRDRIGQGTRDDHAEIRVDNLALSVLGGIQPDKLAAIRDLTSDGLLQRFLPVLMRAPKRGDESYPVSAAENNYAKLIEMVQGAYPPIRYRFAPDAASVRRGVLDQLFSLEQVEGFSSALIGAIGKLRGYYARLALTLHVAAEHSAMMQNQSLAPGRDILRETAEAAEKLLFDFLLPHIFGLYDVIGNGGNERETVRAIASFVLASDKDRLRPSDMTSGVRRLRGEPQNKIAEWASRFCAMGWLAPETENTPTPSAWLVVPGLREHFAQRREQARIARAHAHAILKAGGARP
jgi:hypothetical protein